MKAMDKDWYKKIWTLDIRNMSWVEDTKRQVDFIIKTLDLKGNEKVLDLVCGFGRHALEFARRGYDVTGVDITPEYVACANEQAKKEKLQAAFICADIREVNSSKVLTWCLIWQMVRSAIWKIMRKTKRYFRWPQMH